MTGRAKVLLDALTMRAAWVRRLVFILLIVGGVWLGVTRSRMDASASPLVQATAFSTNIVISQFRTNGSGGPTDEFIELFNPTGIDVNISGWNIRYSASNGTPIIRCTIPSVPSTVVLSPGQHYLIASGGFDDGYAVDLACDLAMADDGGIAVTLGDPDNTVVDAVGMSTGTAFKEGTILSPLNSGDDSYIRRPYNNWHGCYDNEDNSLDFVVSSPAQPQNISSLPLYNCGSAPTATNTPTITETGTPTLTPTAVVHMSVVINEVAWAGTGASPYDEWIELYNTTSNDIDLTGWKLTASNNGPTILLSGLIPAKGYYLLEGGDTLTDDSTVSNIEADQIFVDNSSINLSNNGAFLQLISHSGDIVDTANTNGGKWDGGSSYPAIRSMERRYESTDKPFPDGPVSWIIFYGTDAVKNGKDARGNLINGTPRSANWANSVTPTFTFTPTNTATRTLTRTPTHPPPPTITRTPTLIKDFVILNEVLPHATTDYNSDGKVDVGDEYIELINMSNFNVGLQGWLLSDRDPTTGSYAFPAILMSPGERMAFYSSQTGQYLSDGGDIVILIRPGGTAADILTYPVVDQLGKSWCRYPDGIGPWYFGCIPSPNLSNTYQPNPVPTPTPLPQAGPVEDYFSACPLTGVEENVARAECDLPGLDTWDPAQWDAPDFNTLPLYLQNKNSKPVSLE
jgi:hypothetical protein